MKNAGQREFLSVRRFYFITSKGIADDFANVP